MHSRRHGLVGVALSPFSAYIEKQDDEPGWHDRLAQALHGRVWLPAVDRLWPAAWRLRRLARRVAGHQASALSGLADEALQAHVVALRRRMRRERPSTELSIKALAAVCEAAHRTLGLQPHDVQMMGAWTLLEGRLAEMATGEGKTLTAALAVAAAALSGVPVHAVTVNDYLAERDARIMSPLFAFLGLRVGVVTHAIGIAERRAAYACDITYCTNKELAFDYLKDRLAMMKAGGRAQMALDALGREEVSSPLLLRGLHFAVVDEADSIFIDEARTPLILSASVGEHEAQQLMARVLGFARLLVQDEDFILSQRDQLVELTPDGQEKAANFDHDAPHEPRGVEEGGVWRSKRARKELTEQALSALHLYERDRHYVVIEGKVQIVDEFTGRILADRSWENGLHQMIEVKEGCELSARRVTLARVTYQRLFGRYVRLAGMTGTASEVAGEIWSTYGLRTVVIPLHKASLRCRMPARLVHTVEDKWQQVVTSVQELAVVRRRPVLVGTRSVEASEQLSARLHTAGVAHVLLNAKQDQGEAEAIASAGAPGRVTVATNMAGRGTDIKLDESAVRAGGLHVILTECHGTARIDRQLIGRGARQGDPGSFEMIMSLEDEIIEMHAGPALGVARWLLIRRPNWQLALLEGLRWFAQGRAQRRDAQARHETMKMDERLDTLLAFAGVPE